MKQQADTMSVLLNYACQALCKKYMSTCRYLYAIYTIQDLDDFT